MCHVNRNATSMVMSSVQRNPIFVFLGYVVSDKHYSSMYMHRLMQASPLLKEWKKCTWLTYGIAEDRVDSFCVQSMRISMTFECLKTEV